MKINDFIKLATIKLLLMAASLGAGGAAYAQSSYTTGFEPPEFTLGNVNGQNGWGYFPNSPTKGVIETTPAGSPASFGVQSLAIRTNNVDFFGVANHLFSATIDPAGETGSTIGGVVVNQPANHFTASFYYRTPSTPLISTLASGRFAELNPSSKGTAPGDAPNRYAQVRVVNDGNSANGTVKFEIGWYTVADSTFVVATVAQGLNWGEWYRLDYDIRFVDGLGCNGPNDIFTLKIYDLNNNLVGTATGSTWETAWKTGNFGGGSTPRAVNGFDFWSRTGPNDQLVGHLDEFSIETNIVTDVDLSITKSDATDPVLAGEQISYHLVVTNNGIDDALNVVVTDRIPSSATFVSATSSQGMCTVQGGIVTCQLGSLDGTGNACALAQATVDVVVQTFVPNIIYNTGSVASDTVDSNPGDNEDVESTLIIGLRKLSFQPSIVIGGCPNSVSTGTLLLTGPAPAGGLTLSLADDSNKVDTPPTVTVNAGETSATFNVVTHPVSSELIVIITATAGTNSISARMKLLPVRIDSLTFNPNPVAGGTTVTATVTLNCVAPQDILVTLSYDKAMAKPNVTSFTIPQGQMTGTFTITTKVPLSQTVATITAKAIGGSKSATLTVTP